MDPSHKKPKLESLTQPADLQKAPLPLWDKNSCQSGKWFWGFSRSWWWWWWWWKQRGLFFYSPKSTGSTSLGKVWAGKETFPSVFLPGCAVCYPLRQAEQGVTVRVTAATLRVTQPQPNPGDRGPFAWPRVPSARMSCWSSRHSRRLECEGKGKKSDVPLGLLSQS